MTREARCPDCGATIALRREPRLGLRIECRECGAELEVINVDPLEIDWWFEDDSDDDWDDDDDGWGNDDD